MSRDVRTASFPATAVVVLVILLLPGCGAETQPSLNPEHTKPMRVVSLDLCADQYVLKLVDRERILAVSPKATADFSYMREAAAGVPVVRPVAEDVLALKPDLVVRAYGGGPGATAFFERAGIPIVKVGWASDIAAVFDIVRRVSTGLQEQERGTALIEHMARRLDRLAARAGSASTLYMTPSGVTTGPGSLVHDMIVRAGLTNFQTQPGWNPIPLERLAYDTPDRVAAAFFDTRTSHPDAWSAMRHPVARATLRGQPTVPLKGAWTACAGWFLMDAVEALADPDVQVQSP